MTLKMFINRLAIVLFSFFMTSIASAHFISAQRGTIHLVGNLAYVVVSVSASAFQGIDDDQNGFISTDELRSHQSDVKQQFAKGVQVGTEQGAQWADILLSVSAPDAIDQSQSTQIAVMAVAQFTQAPSSFDISFTLFGDKENEQQMQLLASTKSDRGEDKNETLLLRPSLHRVHVFDSVMSNLKSFVALGVEHILTGFDHLLFLVTLLTAGVWLRRWLLLLMAFTVAHACTFTLASLGFIVVSPRLIEPLIALTIIAVAFSTLCKLTLSLRVESIIIFFCGLVHGLGFASALGLQSSSLLHPAWSILGFNVGVECGQLGVAAVVWMLVYCWRELRQEYKAPQLQRGLSLAMMLLGSALLWSRL